jgi:hypothetical protein
MSRISQHLAAYSVRPKRVLAAGCRLSALFLLASCILVDDFGSSWKFAKADPCLSKLVESLYFTEFRRDPDGKKMDEHAHAFAHEGFNYLLLKKSPEDKGGRLYRFQVQSGVFIRYRLNPVMRDIFTKNHPDAPVKLTRDTVTIPTLNEESLKLLTEISGNADYWEADDKALYNTFLNPQCRFDDRDVKALIEAEKPKDAK